MQNGRLAVAGLAQGDYQFTLIAKIESAAADDNNSIYRIGPIVSNAIIYSAKIFNDAITSGNDWNFGLYYPGLNENVVSGKESVFGDALDLSSANAPGSAGLNAFSGGLTDVNDLDKKLYDHAGVSRANARSHYDLGLKAIAAGTGGTIVMVLQYIIG